jgi:hypothetical protein
MAGRNFLLAAAALLLSGGMFNSAMSGQLYRWVDADGVVHYGDRIPPEATKLDREEINEYGVTVKKLPHEMTDEESAELQRKEAIEVAEEQRAREASERDVVLLNTYLSVEEIEALRNRRKELLDGQIRVTELYLENLRTKLAKLQKDASRFQPYNPDPNAPPIHDWMAKELSNTLTSILSYEQTLSNTRESRTELVAKFDSDIDRYRSLRGLN